MTVSEIRPASTITTEITIEKFGRRMKKSESIRRLPRSRCARSELSSGRRAAVGRLGLSRRLRRWRGRIALRASTFLDRTHDLAGPHFLPPFDDDAVSVLQAFGDCGALLDLIARVDVAPLDLVVCADHEHEFALRVLLNGP